MFSTGFFIYVYLKSDKPKKELEDHIVETYVVINEFKSRIESIFGMNIHFYDDTVFEFVEELKKLNLSLEELIKKHEQELEFTPIEEEPIEQPKEVLGVFRK